MRPKVSAPTDGQRSSRPGFANVTRSLLAPPRIAILGAGGFIGSHLVPALALRPGARIVAIDVAFDKLPFGLPGVERVQASIKDRGVLDAITARADLVISLTALCNPALYNTRPIEVIDASYTDLVPLVKLCAERRRRLIHLSTCEVYGRRALRAAARRDAWTRTGPRFASVQSIANAGPTPQPSNSWSA